MVPLSPSSSLSVVRMENVALAVLGAVCPWCIIKKETIFLKEYRIKKD